MPFTALKPGQKYYLLKEDLRCAPPNAVYGIETQGQQLPLQNNH